MEKIAGKILVIAVSGMILFGVIGIAVFVVSELMTTPIGMHQMPDAPQGPNLLSAFEGRQDDSIAAHDAARFASVNYGTAKALEHEFTKAVEPNVKTGHQLAQVRFKVRDNVLDGMRMGQYYPLLPALIETYLDNVAGKSGGTLTPENKKAWVDAFYKMYDCAQYASARLAVMEHRKTCPHCQRFAEKPGHEESNPVVCDDAIKLFNDSVGK